MIGRIWRQLIFLPTLAWNVLLGRVLTVRKWWHRIDDHVVLGALPFQRDVPALEQLGVRSVVNTCIEYAGPDEAYRRHGIRHLRVPTVDFAPPTLEHIDASLALMRETAAAGHSTYVHCKAGRGRSATVVMCWLIEQHGMTPAEAQRQLEAIRPHVNHQLDQRSVVREFYQRHLQRQGS
ncbi:MAG: dual specificity protein phosphatase family protein [Planctomycetales bacterium]|nr:dual specificity protein phosphatase family protein [Planctomycetales bacterium]